MDETETDILNDDDDVEPQVTSSDPNERKMARKLRIERRLEAIRKQNIPEGEEEEEEKKTLVQKQMQKSAELLEKLFLEGNELVTNVRVANDSREVDRREEEGMLQEKILEKLEEEATDAKEMFDEIADKWAAILKYNDPLHINDDMAAQREKCEELIRQKDGIIAMLKDEIRQAEIKFSKDQKKQNEDISTLASRIEKQVILMRRAYRQELQLIEDAVLMERKILVDMNDKKWEELYKKREAEEVSNSEKKFEQLEEFENEINRLRRDFQEKYRKVKIKLENDAENLQQEFEKIKALSLINSEKLDYNYQILRKREDENIIIKSQQKRRINKLQDVVNGLRRTIREYDFGSKAQIEKLMQQIHKLQNDVMKIEKKADHFQISNDTKFHQVWDLNKNIVDEILGDILDADRVIYEQQLGTHWTPPEQNVINKSDLPSFKAALTTVSEMANKDVLLKHVSEATLFSKAKFNTVPEEDHDSDKEVIQQVPFKETPAYRRLTKHILKQVGDKSGFFLEERLREILKPYTDDEQTLVKLDNVFSALDIKQEDDIVFMVEFFLPYAHCPICSAVEAPVESELVVKDIDSTEVSKVSSKSTLVLIDVAQLVDVVHQPEGVVEDILANMVDEPSLESNSLSAEYDWDSDESRSGPSVTGASGASKEVMKSINTATRIENTSCLNNHPLVISPVYILRALREFVCKVHVGKETQITMTNRLANKRNTVSRLMAPEDIDLFWYKYQHVFSSMRLKVWDGLYVGLQKYHSILQDRKKLNDEVIMLRKQNEELKNLLARYISGVEKVPPCAEQRENSLSSSPMSTHCRRL